MPLVLRMKHVVKSADLGDPTMLFQMYHRSPIPIERKQTAEMIMKLSANPDDPTNMASAGAVVASAPQDEPAAPMEEPGSGPARAFGRTASRPPQKAQCDEQWTPSIQRGVPISIQQATALRGRETQRAPAGNAISSPASSGDADPIPKSGAMGIAKNTTQVPKPRQSPASDFSVDDDGASDLPGEERRKGKDARRRARASPTKAKEKGTKEKESKEMTDRKEERATVHVAQLDVASSRPSHPCSDAWCLRAADPVA